MKKIAMITAALLALMMVLTGCGADAPSSVGQTAAEAADFASLEALEATEGAGFDNFVTYNTAGQLVDESLFSNAKLTIINIWATYCGPCRVEMPALGELAAEYADDGVQIVGLITDVGDGYGRIDEEGLEAVNALVEATGANYPHLLRSPDVDAVMLPWVYAVPTTLFVDSEGQLLSEPLVGAQDKEGWQLIIDYFLAELEG